MVRKSLNVSTGIKCDDTFVARVHKKHKTPKFYNTGDRQERIDKCLSCTKPAEECRGSCFGRSS